MIWENILCVPKIWNWWREEGVSVTKNTDLRSPKISLNQTSNIIYTHQNFQNTIDLYHKISFITNKCLIGRQDTVLWSWNDVQSLKKRPWLGQLVSILCIYPQFHGTKIAWPLPLLHPGTTTTCFDNMAKRK